MPIPLAVIAIIGAGIVISAAVAIVYWTKILNWALTSLVPWLDKNIPELKHPVQEVFVRIDKLAAPALALLKKTWQQVRETLLQVIEEFEQLSQKEWVLRVTSWVRVKLDALDPAPVVKRVQTEQVISYEDLPQEVREQLLRKGVTTHRIDVTRARDEELDLAMSA